MLDFTETRPPRVPVYRIFDDGTATRVLMSWPEYRREERIHKGRWTPRRPEGRMIHDLEDVR